MISDKGGRGIIPFLIFSDEGGRGGKPISDLRLTRGGGGVWTPPFLADIICEQPLIPFSFLKGIVCYMGLLLAAANDFCFCSMFLPSYR